MRIYDLHLLKCVACLIIVGVWSITCCAVLYSENVIKYRANFLHVKIISLDGSINKGDSCHNRAYHGLRELQSPLIRVTAAFILSH